MKYRLLSAMLLAVGVLTATDPTGEHIDKPPMPAEGWETLHARMVYPEMAQKAGIEGEVLIYVYVDESGQVMDMEVVRGSQETGFVDAACESCVSGGCAGPGTG